MENTTVETPGAVALEPPSTVLNPETVKSTSGGGKADLSSSTTPSIQDVLEKELASLKEADAKAEAETRDKAQKAADEAKAKADAAKGDDKPKADQKSEKPSGNDDKFAKADDAGKPDTEAKADKGASEKTAAERSAPDDNRQSEGRKYAEPPARFLPEARDKWGPTPYAVKAEMHRISEEVETELRTYRESHEAYEQVREFAELAKQGGTDLKSALQQYVGIENLLRTNPVQGVATILRNIGITPQQYAQHVMQNPQVHQAQPAAANQQAQPQADPKVSAIEQELNALKSQLATAQVMPTLERFAAQHPDYHTLEPQIASVLKSGVIEQLYGAGLSPEQKLAEAYRMVGGRAAPSQPDPGNLPENSQPEIVPPKNAGTKSIRGAPADGADTDTEEPETDLREMLRKEYRKIA